MALAPGQKVPGEDPGDDEVGIAPDGRCEVGVMLLGEPVVAVGGGPVAGLLEAAEKAHAQVVGLRMGLELEEDAVEVAADVEVPRADPEGLEVVGKLVQLVGIRFVVDAVDAGQVAVVEGAGNRFIGGQHEFLDQLVAFVLLDADDGLGIAFRVDVDFGLGHVQFEAAGLHAGLPQGGGDVPEAAQDLPDVQEFLLAQRLEAASGAAGLVGRGVRTGGHLRHVIREQEGVGLLVGEPFVAADDGAGKAALEELALLVVGQEDGLCEPVLVLDEAAEPVGEGLGQHRNDGADEVGGVAPLAGFTVKGRSRADIMADIGDVDPDGHVAVAFLVQGKGVIEVLGILRIDGQGVVPAEVLALANVGVRHAGGQLAGFPGNRLGKFRIEVILVQEGLVLGHRSVRFPEDLDDFTLRIEVPLLPRGEAHDDLVIDFRFWGEARFLRVGDEDVLDDPRVVRDDVVEHPAALEGAGQGGVGPFKDADDADRFQLVASRPV